MRVIKVELALGSNSRVELCREGGKVTVHACSRTHSYLDLITNDSPVLLDEIFKFTRQIEQACGVHMAPVDFTNLMNMVAALAEN